MKECNGFWGINRNIQCKTDILHYTPTLWLSTLTYTHFTITKGHFTQKYKYWSFACLEQILFTLPHIHTVQSCHMKLKLSFEPAVLEFWHFSFSHNAVACQTHQTVQKIRVAWNVCVLLFVRLLTINVLICCRTSKCLNLSFADKNVQHFIFFHYKTLLKKLLIEMFWKLMIFGELRTDGNSFDIVSGWEMTREHFWKI